MNIWEIVKDIGSDVLRNVVPGASAVLDIVDSINDALPDNMKISENSTGHDIERAINTLSPDQRAVLMGREFDVTIEKYKTLQTMLTVDATSKHTTRPWIAKSSFIFTALFSGVVGSSVVFIWVWAVIKGNSDMVKVVMDGWPFVTAILLTVTGTFTMLLKGYFGLLTKESEQKIGAATGRFRPNAIGNIINAIKGK